MGLDLNRDSKISRVLDGVAAGTTDKLSAAVDMAGFESCTFIVAFGTLTANQVTSVEIHQSDAVGGSYTALLGSNQGDLDDGDDDDLVVITVVRPTKQFLKCQLNLGTANAVIDGIIAIQTPAHKTPVTHGADVVQSATMISPIEGTA